MQDDRDTQLRSYCTDGSYVSSVRFPMLSGMVPRILRLRALNPVLHTQPPHAPFDDANASESDGAIRFTHTPRFVEPPFPEHVTPDQPLSHGSLPVVWFCQPVLPLVLHVLPLVAMYSSTSAARWSLAVGATTPTRTPHLIAGVTSRTRAPRTWATERVNSAPKATQSVQSRFARRG
jgi:hypothetical protein